MLIIGKVNWNIVYLLLSQPPAGQLSWKTKLAELKIRNQSPLKVKGNPLIYLQDHGAKFLIFVQLFSTGQDGGCLSCPWRTIQKEVRQAVLTDKLLNWRWGEKEMLSVSVASFTVGQSWAESTSHLCSNPGHGQEWNVWRMQLSEPHPKSLVRFFKVITAETTSLSNVSRFFN